MCCSSARGACSDFTRASFAARSSRRCSSFAEVPIFFRSSVTASENFAVVASYSVASRVFSSQRIGPVSHEDRLDVPQSRSSSRFFLSLVGHSFSAAHFLEALLRANSCALQLRGFCFHGSSRIARVPPIKQPLALGAEASRFWVPQENGAEKGDSRKCLTSTQFL